MRHTRYWLYTALLAATLGALPVPARAGQETITIVADEWCPYNCAENAENPGYIVEIARAVFKKHGIDVIYKVIPWSDAVEKTRQGEYNAVIAATFNDAPDFVFPETVQGISQFICWVRPDFKWRYQGPASLDKLRIGLIANLAYGEVLDAYFAGHQDEIGTRIFITKSDNASEENIEKLMAGEFDVIIEDRNVASYYFVARHQPKGIKNAGNPIDMEHVDDLYLYLAFSPNNPKSGNYAAMLTEGMAKMRTSGELSAILAKYEVDQFYHYFGNKKHHARP